jgi:hypothetical protein
MQLLCYPKRLRHSIKFYLTGFLLIVDGSAELLRKMVCCENLQT